MKNIRRIVSVLMVTVFAISMAGCAFSKSGVHNDAIKAAKGYGIEEVGSRTELIRATSSLTKEGSAYLVAIDSEEATKFYATYFNTRKRLPDVDAENCLIINIREKGDAAMHACSVYSIEFKNKDDARDVFDQYSKEVMSSSRIKDKDQGDKNNYSYAIAYERSSSTIIRGMYLEGKSITYVQANSYREETNAFADYFLRKMGYISPTELIGN